MATTVMAIEFGEQRIASGNSTKCSGVPYNATNTLLLTIGANNTHTQNFNTLVLQLISQINLIKDQDYKGYVLRFHHEGMFIFIQNQRTDNHSTYFHVTIAIYPAMHTMPYS